MASPYKFLLLTTFLAATGFSIWTGIQIARSNPTTTLRPLQPNPSTVRPSAPGQGASTNVISREPEQSGDRNLEIEECTITMAQVNDPQPPLSIRDRPSPTGAIVSEADNGQIIDIAGTQGDWFAVTSPVQGWVPRSLTEYNCNTKVARVKFPRGARSIDLASNFVGTGNHQYKLRASKNQTITLTNQTGPMPQLKSPGNRVLFAGPQEGDPASWSARLPEDGDYLLQLDSNFRGYSYAFNVKID